MKLVDTLEIDTGTCDTEHFLTSRSELRDIFKGRKSYLMETFYRHMRRKLGVLMSGNKPLTGRWNYDAENRSPAGSDVEFPEALGFNHNVESLCRLIERHGVRTMGMIDAGRFQWPATRREALRLLSFFLTNCLADFGVYQDAMTTRHASLFHSRLSFALNSKMLGPAEVVDRALRFWQNHRNTVSMAQIEGFVRQIIGWREFMRGVYWARMPGYRKLNFFNHRAHLPACYWTGKTRMNCLNHVIGQSLEGAYAHHIQRLMVAGNFALLAGVDPDEVDNWYLGVYIDAVEWVEITNTRGMSQFADGGIVATKPYVSSANYIDRMSDYCQGCFYDKARRYGNGACPFNSLYWDFLHRHGARLRENPRMRVIYRVLDRMERIELREILRQAAKYRANTATL
jgi:deoxyribodipyrimidine photolyase-related protein